ncbi:MAG: hypothetical protein U0T75_10335 [Chitinophagales bacterium]
MLKFTIVDYTTSELLPTTMEVDEPIGWDAIALRLKRDNSWEGFFDYWDDSLSQLLWTDIAMTVLNNGYWIKGVDAHIELVIDYKCGDDNLFENLYRGRFNFTRFKYNCADLCGVQCGVENINCLLTLRNRVDQQFDLTSLQSMQSESNDLAAYNCLDKLIVLPAKPFEFNNEWEATSYNFNYNDVVLNSFPSGTFGTFYYAFNWDIDIQTEIKSPSREEYIYGERTISGAPLSRLFSQQNGILEWQPDESLLCEGSVQLHLKIEGEISISSSDTINFTGNIFLIYGNKADPSSMAQLNLQTGFGCSTCNSSGGAINIDENLSLDLKKGDSVYILFGMSNFYYSTGGGGGTPSDPFELSIHIDNASLKITVDSTCAPTPAKVYMINEVLSRLAEAYTGDCLRVYSDYFGRVDAQPYPSAVNGCGALACITSGLKIRTKDQGFIRIGDSEFTPGFTLSMRECFDALNAIHNIGMGIEPDLVRNDGSDWLRIEPMEYFYRDDVLLTCTGIRELRREFDPTKAFDRATIGYSNWETESVNGLNDVFGKREYRTSLKQLRNLYERLCPFIASDYAIEITRRQYGNTTKDWRYDNDTFIICLRNGSLGTARFQGPHTISVNGDFTDTLQAGDSITITGSGFNNGTFTLASFSFDGAATDMVMVETVVSEVGSSGVLVVDETHPFYTVEQNAIEPGGSTANILYPEYCYNLRITPARNALRHTKTLMSGYGNNWADKQVLFSAGDGNYVAILDLKENDCTIEQDGALLENGNISVDTVIYENSIKPIYTAERVTFEYPVSYAQYKTIKANPYGLIGYQCGGGDVQYGYIEDFSYKPVQGIAEFTLRPKL